MTLRRSAGVAEHEAAGSTALTAFSLPGIQGNEREAMDRVAAALADLGLPEDRLERLKTAVSEAAMNAIEYGSQGNEEVPFEVDVTVTPTDVVVRVTDRAMSGAVPTDPETPDIERKLVGEQKPRGWGLFLIEAMVDEVAVEQTENGQTVVLTLNLEGDA